MVLALELTSSLEIVRRVPKGAGEDTEEKLRKESWSTKRVKGRHCFTPQQKQECKGAGHSSAFCHTHKI